MTGETASSSTLRTTGADPERGHPEGLDVVEPVDDALPVAAVVARLAPVVDVEVVVGITVLEPVDDDLMVDLRLASR